MHVHIHLYNNIKSVLPNQNLCVECDTNTNDIRDCFYINYRRLFCRIFAKCSEILHSYIVYTSLGIEIRRDNKIRINLFCLRIVWPPIYSEISSAYYKIMFKYTVISPNNNRLVFEMVLIFSWGIAISSTVNVFVSKKPSFKRIDFILHIKLF